MIQVEVSLNHVIEVYSRQPTRLGLPYALPWVLGGDPGISTSFVIINKESGASSDATINSTSYSGGLLTIDFDYQTKEASSYYLIFTSDNVEMFKSMMFATNQTTKTPYQNVEVNNDITPV
jgi:hypothetical protein